MRRSFRVPDTLFRKDIGFLGENRLFPVHQCAFPLHGTIPRNQWVIKWDFTFRSRRLDRLTVNSVVQLPGGMQTPVLRLWSRR